MAHCSPSRPRAGPACREPAAENSPTGVLGSSLSHRRAQERPRSSWPLLWAKSSLASSQVTLRGESKLTLAKYLVENLKPVIIP